MARRHNDRKRRGRVVNGWLIVDKPSGMTSTTVVNRVKRLYDAAKAGHGGTLDPLATGLLPIAFGEATKTVPYVMDGLKTYRFTLRLGQRTETDDAEGDVVEESDVRPSEEDIRAALPQFIGNIQQTPPIYSAIKVNGERAYDLARANKPVVLEPRPIYIEGFQLIGYTDSDHADFLVMSGKGAYMRSLARDLAQVVGTEGHISALRRLKVGPFTENDAISLDELDSIGQIVALEQRLLPVAAALDDIPALRLTEIEASRLKNGQTVSLLRKVDLQRIADFIDGDTVLATGQDGPIALVRYMAGEVQPIRLLNL
ncbi:MAG: tRNA pseudouridine(55) synthase TruB [Alphaproteobacteria bacterium]|nr:tRNA pseudouridine(55) synthase TruB [Alphaproteobacteria bacterium]